MGRRGYGRSHRAAGYGYSGYHGRSRTRIVLVTLIVILAVVLAAVFGLFLMQEKWLVFSDEGVKIKVPFATEAPTAPPEATKPMEVVIVPPTATPAPTPAPTPTPEPPVRAVMAPRTALTDGSAASVMASAGANAVVFDMKADDGTLGYSSQLEYAGKSGASGDDPALNDAIRALNAGDVYTVARVSCFRDNKVPFTFPKLGVKTYKDYNWRDKGDLRWMSPTSPEARAYVAGVCRELAALGFDEILLDNSGYPTEGRLKDIRPGEAYDAAQFSSVVSAFYGEIRSALAAYPQVKLSIRTDAETLAAGSSALSGQSTAGMLAAADHIWVRPGEGGVPAAQQALAAAGASSPAEVLLPILSPEQAGDPGTAWARLTA